MSNYQNVVQRKSRRKNVSSLNEERSKISSVKTSIKRWHLQIIAKFLLYFIHVMYKRIYKEVFLNQFSRNGIII
jgi:hypothetical protein